MSGPVTGASPWAFHPHVAVWAIVGGGALAYLAAVRQPSWRVTRRQGASFIGGLALVLLALTWPVADLAAHWSLLALVLQRLLLLVAAPPLLLAGAPPAGVAALTRPAPVDAVLRACSRPVPAIVVVTVVAVGTLTTGAVDAQASSAVARAALSVLLLLAGVVLWTPVLGSLPGTLRLSALGCAGYLVAQSIIPSFLSVVWIFAHHPLYPAFDGRAVAGMSPLLDQQISGFVAKLSTIAVLWTVAFVMLSRSQRQGDDPEPLTWADVQRELERAERRQRRHASSPEPPEPG